MTRLAALGWDDRWSAAFDATLQTADAKPALAGFEPARVAIEFNQNFRLYTAHREIEAVTAGRLKHSASSRAHLPAVGDWVALRHRAGEDRGSIVAVLPRRSWFSRKVAGQLTDEQVIAANLDVAFVVMGLDADFSTRRLERYLLLARESGASPVVVLTKPDLASDLLAQVAMVAAVAGALPVHVLNPRAGEGIAHVGSHLGPGRTGALLGSSGVGKSTIINRLVGEELRRTREVRVADSRGRHTTTHRELVMIPGGGLVIDTPGMRELQLWDVTEAVRETFEDIERLASDCRFTDCRHRDEPRCAVKAAVAEGRLDAARLASYVKLQDELNVLAHEQDERALLEQKRQGRHRGGAPRSRHKEQRR